MIDGAKMTRQAATHSDAREPALNLPASPVRPRFGASWAAVTVICLAVWGLARWCFFAGYEGSDDMFYMRFAALWNRPPANHWEARLLGNALLRLCITLFGVHEWVGALPSLAASLVVLVSTLLTCRWFATLRSAWWAGLLVAVLPIEVRSATIVSAHSVMVGFMAVGTLAFLRADVSSRACWIAATCLPLGVIAHYNGSYYVASLITSALLLDGRRTLKPVACVAVGGVLAFAGEMLAFQLLAGDPMHGLRLSSPKVLAPQGAVIYSLTAPMVLWSLQQFAVGQPFGIALLITAVGTLLCVHRTSRPLRLLALAALGFWLMLNFGSYVPWDYRPFWRNARYMSPLAMPVAVLFGVLLAESKDRRLARLCGGATLASCLVMLVFVGNWGQSVRISGELLAYVLRHPERRFVTDVHTANEIYVLNGLNTPPNLAATSDFGRSHYLDKRIRLIPDPASGDCDAVLLNPLNAERTPSFVLLVESELGATEHATATSYRGVCGWIPGLRDRAWAVRKPGARVHAVLRSDLPDGPVAAREPPQPTTSR